MKKKELIIIFIAVIVFTYYISCTSSYKIDEKVFYKDAHMELKVARYQEHIFLHYNGPVFFIGCKSSNTRPQTWAKIKDKNWKQIPNYSGLSGLGWDPDLDVLVNAAKSGYHVTDNNTLIFQTGGGGVKITWDGCGTFKSWSPQIELIDPQIYQQCINQNKEKEDKGSLPQGWGKSNCKRLVFNVDMALTYRNLKASNNGYASFEVSSKALILKTGYKVTTQDYGKTWNVVEN